LCGDAIIMALIINTAVTVPAFGGAN